VNGNTYIFGQLGVNITPGTRTLDVNGDFRAQDAAGNKVDFTGGQVGVNRDPQRTLDISGTFRVESNATTLLDVNSAAVTAPGGYTSVTGSISADVGTTTIGPIKRGLLHVAAIDQASITNQAFYTFFASSTSNVSVIATAINGDTDITPSGSNLQISNASTTKTYDYSITYFPL
jgi:multisubunit Na+/H+ antiporter MnhE subunit